MNDNRFCVYLHRRKDNNEVFYVGSGTKERVKHTTTRSTLWKDIKTEAGGVICEILEQGLSKEVSLQLELEYIDKYKDTIVNCTHYSPIVKDLNFDDFNSRVYLDSSSPTNLRYKVDIIGMRGKVLRRIGDVAGSIGSNNRVQLRWGNKNYNGARIVYLLSTGSISTEDIIDHIDSNTLNNNPSNLRKTSPSLNSRNCSKNVNNSTTYTGVSYSGINGTYRATIRLNGKNSSRSFSVSKYGLIPAFYLACQWRKEQIAILNANGAGYSKRHGT